MKRLVALACALLPGLAWAKKAPSLPVMQFDAQNGADARLAALATDAASESLRDLDVFKVISSDDIKKILSFQRQKTLAGGQCTEDQCLAEIGGALGADYMVSGKLTQIGGALKLDLQLFNNAKAKVDNAVSQDGISDEKSLVQAAKRLARRAVAPILEKNSGQLFVSVTDNGAAGAAIDVDDKTVSTTVPPGVQPGPVVLGWGPHHAVVKKEGFVTFEKDIQIDEGQPTTLVVTLVPSPDFIDAYKSRNSKLRIGAYVGAVLAVGLGGVAEYENYQNALLYKRFANASNEVNPPTDPNAPRKPYPGVGGCDVLSPQFGGGCDAAMLNKAAAAGNSQKNLAIGLAAGAVVAAGASVAFFVLGDDPHRYDGFIQASPASGTGPARTWAPSFSVAPLPGGALAAFGLQL